MYKPFVDYDLEVFVGFYQVTYIDKKVLNLLQKIFGIEFEFDEDRKNDEMPIFEKDTLIIPRRYFTDDLFELVPDKVDIFLIS